MRRGTNVGVTVIRGEVQAITKISALLAVIAMAAVLASCGGGGGKTYDIGPVFPASSPSEKCARYNGDLKGSGPLASCMVTKSECERAAADWNESMRNSGINNPVLFSCE